MARYIITNRREPIDFALGNGTAARTVQNAKNLLMCRRGEIPYDRLRGFDTELYDLPLQKMQEKIIKELDRVMLWESDAEVEDALCTREEDGGVLITVTIDVNDN